MIQKNPPSPPANTDGNPVESLLTARNGIHRQALRETGWLLGGLGIFLYLLLFFGDTSPTKLFVQLIQPLQVWKIVDSILLFLVGGVFFIPLMKTRQTYLDKKSQQQSMTDLARDLFLETQGLEKNFARGQLQHEKSWEQLEKAKEEAKVLANTIVSMGQQFQDLSTLSGDVYWVLDTEGRIKFISGTVDKMLGYPQSECTGRLVTDFLPEQTSWTESDQEAVMQLMNGNRVTKYETQILHKDESTLSCLISITPVEDGQGGLSGFSGSVAVVSDAIREGIVLRDRIHLVYNHSEKTGYLPTAMDLDELLEKHLNNVTEVTEKAAFDLATQVQDIDKQLVEIMEFFETSNIWQQEIGSQSKAGIEEDRETIAKLSSFITETEERKRQEWKRGETVISEISQLKNLVNIVYEISDRTNVLALNAGIIAARAGEHGRQFAVVASEVRKLSAQVKDAAEQIGEGINQSVESIQSLFNVTSSEATLAVKDEEKFLKQTSEKMTRMGQNYAKLLDVNESTMTKIGLWNQSLAEKVMELLSSFQFQDITRQQIEQVVNALERRREYTVSLMEVLHNPEVDYHSLEEKNFSVNSLFKHYVMAGQRETHQEQTGEESLEKQEEVVMIDLF